MNQSIKDAVSDSCPTSRGTVVQNSRNFVREGISVRCVHTYNAYHDLISKLRVNGASLASLRKLSRYTDARDETRAAVLSTAIITPINGDAPPPRYANADDAAAKRALSVSTCADQGARITMRTGADRAGRRNARSHRDA